jgi:hypothetical protein
MLTSDNLSRNLGTLKKGGHGRATVSGLQGTVADACTQLSAFGSQVNEVATAVSSLTVNNALTLLGGLLGIPALPKARQPYTCK